MSMRTVLVVLFALVFGVCAVVGVNAFRNRSMSPTVVEVPVAPEPVVQAPVPTPTPPPPPEETVSVVVATTDITRFTIVKADMFKIREYPKSFAPVGAVGKIEDAIERDTLGPIQKDEAVLESRLAVRGSGRGLATIVPHGMRAVTILTPSLSSGLAGFALPGNKVDVLYTSKSRDEKDPNGGATTTTLLQQVEILAVDQRLDPGVDNKTEQKDVRSVTLLVTPNQAAKVDLAQNLGTLHLSLRNPNDKDSARTEVATANQLKFFQGKPLDERLKEVFAGAYKLIPEWKTPVVKPEVKVEPPPPPPVVKAEPAPLPPIRTYRGTSSGLVHLK